MPYEFKPFEHAFELVYMHIPQVKSGVKVWNLTQSFEQSNRLLSLKHSNFANKSIKHLLECVIYEPCMLLNITSSRFTIDKFTVCEWVITVIANLATVQSIYISFLGCLIINRYILCLLRTWFLLTTIQSVIYISFVGHPFDHQHFYLEQHELIYLQYSQLLFSRLFILCCRRSILIQSIYILSVGHLFNSRAPFWSSIFT